MREFKCKGKGRKGQRVREEEGFSKKLRMREVRGKK